jgi:hypothetical protein
MTYSEPIVARISLGKSVRTSFLHVRCVILLGEKREERRSWVEVSFFPRFSLYQCTREVQASACGRASEECSKEVRTINIRIRSRTERPNICTTYQRRDGQCTVQIIVIGRGTMSVDGLIFVEISQIQSHYRRPTKTFEDPGASLPFGLGKCECECYKQMPGMCSQPFQSLLARCSVVRDSRAQKLSFIHQGLPGQ